jgi:DNA-binding GntR family transcriptional regulator
MSKHLIKEGAAMAKIPDVRRNIREDIVAGRLGLGSRVTIDELASRYGVSHMPIREALRELHGEGLIVIEPNRGARVRPIDMAFVENFFDTRSALEVVLTRRAARLCTPAIIAELHRIETELEALMERGETAAVLAANRAFHQCIYEHAGNPEALAVVDRHWLLIAALWARYGYGKERFVGVANDHRHIILALESADPEAAGALMTAHVLKAKQDMMQRMRAASAPAAAAS